MSTAVMQKRHIRRSLAPVSSYRVFEFMSVRNSSRVFCWVRKQPSIHDVIVAAPGFWTPRMVMHMCLGYESVCVLCELGKGLELT